MQILVRESLPRWYGLFWRPQEPALGISVHEQFLESVAARLSDPKTAAALVDDFGFGAFSRNLRGSFGFDDALTWTGSRDNFQHYLGLLPKVRRETEELCGFCGGAKYDGTLRRACPGCHGSGKEVRWDRTPGYALSATLGLFLRLAAFPEERVACRFPQLFTVQISTAKNHAAMSGMYGVELVRWLSEQGHRQLENVKKAMVRAYGHMVSEGARDASEFRVNVGNGGELHLVPGHRGGIDPSARSYGEGEGYEFQSHNIDVVEQQLTLLAGLAALHDEVDRNLAKE